MSAETDRCAQCNQQRVSLAHAVDSTNVDVRMAAHVFVEEAILRYFRWQHLPPALQKVSHPFQEMADLLMQLPRCAERTVALRKLLESKDAAVRAALP